MEPIAGKTVLFVDDELDMRIFLAAVLRTGGYRGVAARNAVEALAKARALPPELIVMDVMMPEAGGVTLYQELKRDERLKRIPVIVLTGVSAQAFAHHLHMVNLCREESLPPPEGYLEKPLDPERLLGEIRRLIG
jgi:CheY-like chemotaxis protein